MNGIGLEELVEHFHEGDLGIDGSPGQRYFIAPLGGIKEGLSGLEAADPDESLIHPIEADSGAVDHILIRQISGELGKSIDGRRDGVEDGIVRHLYPPLAPFIMDSNTIPERRGSARSMAFSSGTPSAWDAIAAAKTRERFAPAMQWTRRG